MESLFLSWEQTQADQLPGRNRADFSRKRVFTEHSDKTSLCEMCPNTEFFFWSVFSRSRTEYGEIRSISSYSLRMRENMDQKKLRIWTLFMQCFKWGRKKVSMLLYKIIFFWLFSIFILGIYPSPPTHPHPASTSPTCFMVSPSV